MIMNINYPFVDKILDAIFPLPEKFGIRADVDYVENIEAILQKDISKDIRVCHGISKMVILAPALGDIVIKIPFNGQYTYGARYGPWRHSSKWVGETEWGKPIEFEYFSGASGSDETDYCLAEYEKYQNLKDSSLDIFVAQTLFYKVKNDVRIFLQERANAVEDSIATPRPSENSVETAKKYYNNTDYAYMNLDWVANCIDSYGRDITERFLRYVAEEDEDILGDMHNGNFGYRDDGTPVLLDFCDFHS